jgi:hypothetical protein
LVDPRGHLRRNLLSDANRMRWKHSAAPRLDAPFFTTKQLEFSILSGSAPVLPMWSLSYARHRG